MPKKNKYSEAPSRRTFLRVVPAATLCTAIQETAPAQNPTPDPLSAQADALAEVARLRYGSYLKEGDLNDIKRVIERNLRYSDALAKVKVSNSDEPDFIFIPNASL